jgi:hypothetical protein
MARFSRGYWFLPGFLYIGVHTEVLASYKKKEGFKKVMRFDCVIISNCRYPNTK